jgi:DNA-binding Lrp family transcriptional regulator
MDFRQASELGSFLSKDYSEELFRLLATYSSISASEAASRLNLHVKTVQDFLEGMHGLGILDREEVYEKKRPYFRYRLKVKSISLNLDLGYLFPSGSGDDSMRMRIRERMNAGARFTVARSDKYISNIVIWAGKGRDRTERRINLSIPQGQFLYHLPFPTADFQNIGSIMERAGLDRDNSAEILDIVYALAELGVIETDHKRD